MSEREAIVSWLRERAERYWSGIFDHDGYLGDALDLAADMIERGDHIKETEDEQ